MTRRMIRNIVACTLITAAAVGAAFSTDITQHIARDTTWGYATTDGSTPPAEDGSDGSGGGNATNDTTWG